MNSKRIPRVSLIDSVVQQIEEAIISGEYPPNSKLPGEAALSAEMEVSRPVVREALAQLRERGYLSTYNGRGTYVHLAEISAVTDNLLQQLRPHMGAEISVDDTFEARRMIEVSAVSLATDRATDEDFERMAVCIQQMQTASPEDPASFTAGDVGFHVAIARAARNPLYPVLLSPLVDLIVTGMYESVRSRRAAMESGIEDHQRILSCLTHRDREGAVLAVEEHLTASWEKHRRFFGSGKATQPGSRPAEAALS